MMDNGNENVLQESSVSGFDMYRIRKHPLFEGIEGVDKELMHKLDARLCTYAPGQLVCEYGQRLDSFGVLIEGEVEGGFRGSGYYQMIERFKGGEVFGEPMCMKVGMAPVEIRALKPTTVLFVKAEPLLNSPDDPCICRVLARVTLGMTDKLITLSNKVRTLRNPAVISRVAGFMLGCPSEEGNIVATEFTQAEIGEYLGSSRSRVSSAVSCLIEDGLIEPVRGRRGAYHILDRRGLEWTAANGRMPEDKQVADMIIEDALAKAQGGEGEAEGDMIAATIDVDSTQTMRTIVGKEPLFEQFLQFKGFPFSVENPITEIVTFDDVVEMQHLDKDAFLAEYAQWKERREAGS